MKTIDYLMKTASLAIIFTLVITQGVCSQTNNSTKLSSDKKIAVGVSAGQSVAAQQNKESMVATMNTLAGSQNTPVSAPVNAPVLMHSGAHAMDVLAPNPTTGILTLPDGLQIDLQQYQNAHTGGAYTPIAIEYYASGNIKKITNTASITWSPFAIPGGGIFWHQDNAVTKEYGFLDEAYYNTSLGSMGRMTNMDNTSWIPNPTTHCIYTYWGTTDTIRTTKTYTHSIIGTLWTNEKEYDAKGNLVRNITYTYDSFSRLASKTLSTPDANGYVYYEYYNDGFSRDQWNNSVGRVKKAVKANGSYTVFKEYYANTDHVKVQEFYSKRGRLTETLYYYENGRLMRRSGHHLSHRGL